MKHYRVVQGPVHPAGALRPLAPGDIFAAEPTSWVRRSLARGRIEEVEQLAQAAAAASSDAGAGELEQRGHRRARRNA